MLKINFKNSYTLILITIMLFSGCGETQVNNPVLQSTKESSFSNLTKEEKNTLSSLNTNQQALLNAINKERSGSKTCGYKGEFPAVPALTWNENLYLAAKEHVVDLAFSDTFSHDGSGTKYDITGNGKPSKFYERIVANGYSHYYSVGENIAGGQRNLEDVMKAWMASPGHCANIMKSTYTEVAVAILIKGDSTYQVYWGQNFGSKLQ